MREKEKELKKFYNSHPTGGQVTSMDKLIKTLDKLGTKMHGKVLDLGCAQGHTCSFAKKLGAEWALGVDMAEERIKIAKEKHPDLEFICMDIYDFVHTTNLTFDIIMLFDTIEHLENPGLLIEYCLQCLSPVGAIISSTPLRMPYESHLQVFKTVKEFEDKMTPSFAVEDATSVLARWDR